MTISPAGAITQVEAAQAEFGPFTALALGQVPGIPVHSIMTSTGPVRLIDAGSGKYVEITAGMAEAIAREDFPSPASVRGVEKVEQHDLKYPCWPLPAHRITFGDLGATVSNVSIADGSVYRSDRLTRTQLVIGSLHTFELSRYLTKRDRLTKLALITASLGGNGVDLTGYLLALPRRRTRPRG